MEKNESEPMDTDAADPTPTIEPETLATTVPQSGHSYLLTPYCTDGHNDQWLVMGMNSASDGPSYALGPVELMQDQGNPTTTWNTLTIEEDGSFCLVNQASLGFGLSILTAPYDDSPVVMVPEGQIDKSKDRWLFKALPVLDNTWYMLQLVENPGVYLNVSGDGPYPAGTVILVYSSPGAPSGISPGTQANQVWRFQEIPNA